MENFIPKKIHYCWFGKNPLPEYAKKCIASWKKFCPDYEIIEWNETNYNINKNQYMKEAYDAKKWGFVPDYARLDIIYEHGGIYLDTDVELVKPIESLLKHRLYMGVERPGIVALGLGFGAEKGHPLIYELRQQYETKSFILSQGKLDLTPAPTHQSIFLKKYGLNENDDLQELIHGCYIYPKEYFNPYNFDTGIIKCTENTFSIHHYAASWTTVANKINTFVYQFICRIFGKKLADLTKRVKRILCNEEQG